MAESHAPTNTQRPEWGWLCATCANGSSKKVILAAREYVNVSAAQCDPEEFKENCERGFMLGMGQEESDE